MCPNPDAKALAVSDVNRIIQQAVARALNLGVKATIAVTDREVNVLAVYRMKGANRFGRIEGGTTPGPLELPSVPNIQTEFMAISKAGTGSVFQTTGNAFSPRSASFIIQENIPPGVNFSPGGPLFGVQFSNLFLISDVNPRLPLGISGDPGAVPLFMGEIPVGGIGVEVEGAYGVDKVPDDNDQSVEEIIARAGARGYESPELIQADNIYVDGVRLPFLNAPPQGAENPVNLSRVGKFLNTALNPLGGIQPGIAYLGPVSQFKCGTLRNMSVRIVNDVLDLDRDNNRTEEAFPIRGNRDLSASEVETILAQA
ncbi:MAG TPA: heme-binding protein, partial [Acidobacteriota bacterium]|nr:heme-binding protein [Acidobacteriota bacterium]